MHFKWFVALIISLLTVVVYSGESSNTTSKPQLEQRPVVQEPRTSPDDRRRLSFQCIGVDDESMLEKNIEDTPIKQQQRKSPVIEAPVPRRPAFLKGLTGIDSATYSEHLRQIEHRIADLEEEQQQKRR